MANGATKKGSEPLNRSLSTANGHRKKPNPGAPGVIVDHVKDENNDGATARLSSPKSDIEDVKLFLKKNKASRISSNRRGST